MLHSEFPHDVDEECEVKIESAILKILTNKFKINLLMKFYTLQFTDNNFLTRNAMHEVDSLRTSRFRYRMCFQQMTINFVKQDQSSADIRSTERWLNFIRLEREEIIKNDEHLMQLVPHMKENDNSFFIDSTEIKSCSFMVFGEKREICHKLFFSFEVIFVFSSLKCSP